MVAGDLRRTPARHDIDVRTAAARLRSVVDLCLACEPHGLSAAAAGTIQSTNVSRLSGGWLSHAIGCRRSAIPTAAALPVGPGPTGLAVGIADDAHCRRCGWGEAHRAAPAQAVRVPPNFGSKYRDDRGHDQPVRTGSRRHTA